MSTADQDKPWALITGASSGIGRALACEFASVGYNVFLTGRDAAALEDVGRECAKEFRTQTRTRPADLANAADLDGLIEAVGGTGLDFEILANNAGFGVHGPFPNTPVEPNLELIEVQIVAALKLTHALLPAMISRGRGHILNVASVYSYAPVPFQSVYAASKSFLLSFSRALGNELEGTGVTVTAFCPGVTRTAFRTRAGIGERTREAGMTAERVAEIAVRETLKGTPVVVPGLVNRLFVLASRWLPSRSVPALVRRINRQRGQTQS